MLVYSDTTKEVAALDFRERAPLKAHRDMYVENGEVVKSLSLVGHKLWPYPA